MFAKQLGHLDKAESRLILPLAGESTGYCGGLVVKRWPSEGHNLWALTYGL